MIFASYSTGIGISLVYHCTIHDNRIGELHGSSVQKHDINSVLIYGRRYGFSDRCESHLLISVIEQQATSTSLIGPIYPARRIRRGKPDDIGMPRNHAEDRFHDGDALFPVFGSFILPFRALYVYAE
jgi:hypothetical protein